MQTMSDFSQHGKAWMNIIIIMSVDTSMVLILLVVGVSFDDKYRSCLHCTSLVITKAKAHY
jgi:hypothetical protein